MPDGYTDEARDALLAKAREAWKDDPALDAQALGDGSGGDSVSCYLRAYYQRLATEDLAPPSRLAAVAEAHARLGVRRPQGRALVQVREPDDAHLNPVSRSGLVVDIVTDDMPYLVDSVTTELNRHEAEILLIVHPLLRVRRDVTGGLRGILGVCEDDAPAATTDEQTESWIHVELGAPRDRVTAEALAADLRHVLDDVRVAAEDQLRMGSVARRLADDLGGEPGSEEAEHGDLLRWLGERQLPLPRLPRIRPDTYRGRRAGLRAVPGTGLGILRHDRQGRDSLRKLSSQVARRAQDPDERLVLAKANSRSTVYRANYLDYVSVKKHGADGTVTGEFRFLGLYTHAAHTAPIVGIPVLRRKLAQVLATAGLSAGQPRREGPRRDTRGLPARGAVRDLGGRAHPDRPRRAAAERAQADQAVPAPGPVRAVHVLPGVPAEGPVHHEGQAARAGHLETGAARGLGGLQRHGRRLGPGPAVRGGPGGAGTAGAAGGRGRARAQAGRGGQVLGRGPRRRGDPRARRGTGQDAARPVRRGHSRDVQGGRHRAGRGRTTCPRCSGCASRGRNSRCGWWSTRSGGRWWCTARAR